MERKNIYMFFYNLQVEKWHKMQLTKVQEGIQCGQFWEKYTEFCANVLFLFETP